MTDTTQPDPQVVACPWCGAPAGQPCRNAASGAPVGAYCGARRDHATARKPRTVADIPTGQGPASLFLWRDPVGGELDLYFKHADGRVVMIGITLDQLSGATTAALTDHLAATLPTVAAEEPQIRSVDTADGVRHYDDTGREYRAIEGDGELTYEPLGDAP